MAVRIRSLVVLAVLLLAAAAAHAQTGKLSGRVTDSATSEPLPGVNVMLQDTYLGAATDADGYYFINNVPPGTYTVVASLVGFKRMLVPGVEINTGLTTPLDLEMSEEVIEGEEVVVTAERRAVQRDLTSTRAIVTSEEMERLPVESVGEVVNLQAGVVASGDGGFHFRGGRSDEVAFLVDGMSVTDPFSGGVGVEVEQASVQEIEVISGTFNAEYGQAMSGVVNIVTKDAARRFDGSASAYLGSYFTPETDLFYNMDTPLSPDAENVQLSVEGPVPFVEGLSFFATGRYFNEGGHLYGQRVFNLDDLDGLLIIPPASATQAGYDTTTVISYLASLDPETARSELARLAGGDSAFVSMNPYRKYSGNLKLTYNRPGFKLSYSLLADDNYNRYYDHAYRLAPDGIQQHYRRNWLHQASFTHVLSNRTFYTLRYSHNISDYEGHVFEDPFDQRYVDPRVGLPLSGYTYRYGGNQGGRYARRTVTDIAQLKLTSQLTRHHALGAGVEARFHTLENHYRELRDVDENNDVFDRGYPAEGTTFNQRYTKRPWEVSAYLQDKMEYDIMIVNAGVRLDYFEPNAAQPADLRNPEGNPEFPGVDENGDVIMEPAPAKWQLSPRLGASFPITERGVLHFAYGYFFQIPTFENLYQNSTFVVEKNRGLYTVSGNPNLEPQRTAMYEFGMQQEIFPNLVLDATAYYRDIRNLLGTEIIRLYEGGFRYSRFINRDYGNVRGVILTLDRRFADFWSAKIDYTYQVAEGNASDPLAVFNDNQTDPPVESEKKTVPLDWDQRHTLYTSVAVGQPENWTVGLNYRVGSGMPYTSDITFNPVAVRIENDRRRPVTHQLDLRAERRLRIGPADASAFLMIYNVLDTQNEYGVYPSTGRAGRDLNVQFAGPVVGLNTIDGYVDNPSLYSEPRQIRVGLSLGF